MAILWLQKLKYALAKLNEFCPADPE